LPCKRGEAGKNLHTVDEMGLIDAGNTLATNQPKQMQALGAEFSFSYQVSSRFISTQQASVTREKFGMLLLAMPPLAPLLARRPYMDVTIPTRALSKFAQLYLNSGTKRKFQFVFLFTPASSECLRLPRFHLCVVVKKTRKLTNCYLYTQGLLNFSSSIKGQGILRRIL
jgi:hypothetical protein